MKHYFKIGSLFHAILLCMGIYCLSSCKDSATDSAAGHNPNQPVEITDFTPKEGAARTRLYIFGKNFGNDVQQISVKVGGVKAKVVGSNGEIIYCLVPFRANEGSIEVAVGPNQEYTKAADIFDYQKKTQVATLCGYVDETGKTEVKDGSFSDCGFKNPRWLATDPQNTNHIYLVDGDPGEMIRMLDVELDSVSTLINKGQGNWNYIRQISFTATGDSMLVANEQDADNVAAVSVMTRANKFKRPETVVKARKNNACSTHPFNGELYYNSRTTGELFRYDWNTKTSKTLYTLNNKDCQFFIFFHPTGKFAYMNVPNKRIMMKAEYDNVKNELKTATIFCGQEGKQDYLDGQGTNAKLGNPMQGCFVKNEQYVKEGKEDVYDFYFCDQYAHAIRYVSPDGYVRTYAGRGSKGVNNNPNGYIDGDLLEEARFDQPSGLAYDEQNKIFYIAEYTNKRIRTIVVDE